MGSDGLLSFKVVLTGGRLNEEETEDYESDDFDMNEGDIITSMVDGEKPVAGGCVDTSAMFFRENGYQGRFARTAISVDLCWPLISKLRVEGKIRRVEHENLPKVCYKCGCFGHMKDMCPKVRKEKESKDMGEEDSGHMATSAAKHLSMAELDRKVKTKSYEDWMVVSRNFKRNLRKNVAEIEGKQSVGTGSRFEVISNSIYEEDESAEQLDRSVEGGVESVDGGENSNGFGLIDGLKPVGLGKEVFLQKGKRSSNSVVIRDVGRRQEKERTAIGTMGTNNNRKRQLRVVALSTSIPSNLQKLGIDGRAYGLVAVDTTVNVMMTPIDMVVDDKITYNGIVGVEIVEGVEPEGSLLQN
ncbi:hypothetical protein Gotri_006956 [Gossypium trilobum]|uniref:CCHC-type domain-containing protein n=1 Tax=Gossypium trilobum TaxID=34281 RepID=A0A7J9FJG9_9ROSI|nr:hypothetical protein [Gossypium trilobum]